RRGHHGSLRRAAGPERAGDGGGVAMSARGEAVSEPSGSLLECRGLAAGYGPVAVVRDLDLHVEPGEVVALIGPNGAGKTTTLLTIAGEIPPIAGEITFRGALTKAP